MGSESKNEIPSIDFSEAGLSPGSPVWKSVRSQVYEGLVKYGCFEACFEKVELELRKSSIEALKEVFDLPLETKQRNSGKAFGGYIGPHPKSPFYESLGIENPTDLQNVQDFTHVLWLQGNPSFCKTIQSFSKKVSALDEMVRKMVLESLGVEKYMDEHINSSKYRLRVMKYKAPETAEATSVLKPHIDPNIVTILYQDQTGGLQIQTREGDWIDVKPSPASFIVMIGNSFCGWTNGRFHSPYHRVMRSGNEARYSLGLFSSAKPGYIIKTPEELIDEEHPLLFKPYDYAEFLAFYVNVTTVHEADTALAAYCGVN